MHRKASLLLLVLAVILLLPTALVSAQATPTGLDPNAAPNYGGAQIPAALFDFIDPFITTIVSGGTVDLAANAGTGCNGFGTSAPDYLFEIQDPFSVLRVMFIAEGDSTLAILQPNNTFLCNDDGVGLSPIVDIPNPAAGIYAIWVGSFASDTYNAGYLLITPDATLLPGNMSLPLLTNSAGTVNVSPAVTVEPVVGQSVNTTPVVGGTVSLSAGFTPDPFTTSVTSGGSVDVNALNLGQDCRGFVQQQPSLILNWSGTANNLRIFFNSAGDSTLVIVGPNNQVYCNDDFPGSLDPLVDISNPAPGTYSIFVGSFSSSGADAGTLYVTEFTTLNPTNSP